jgi:hypothetical protein
VPGAATAWVVWPVDRAVSLPVSTLTPPLAALCRTSYLIPWDPGVVFPWFDGQVS